MALLPLVLSPDPRLKQVSKEVDKVDASIRELMDNMVETMYAQEGIGLAAIQVGVAKRILVMDIEQSATGEKSTPLYLVNPEIVDASETLNDYNEGCLSFPGEQAVVTRPEKVTINYLDYDGNPQTMHADGLLATCVQHEIDHLNGITFIDHLSKLKRDMILKRMHKQSKRRHNPGEM